MRAFRPLHLRLVAQLSLAMLGSTGAQAAAFLPGTEADPPTGETRTPATEPAPSEPLRGAGIQWRLAPWRWGGNLAVDLRGLRLDDGTTTRQQLLSAELEMASHIWQPWFIQVRLGAGLVAAQGGGDGANASTGLTGRTTLSVFPASRFPFELRADLSDSRTAGPSLGSDYRGRRLSLSQGYRPERGNDSYQLQLDRSVLSDRVSSDNLTTLSFTALRQFDEHNIDLGISHSDNQRSIGDERTRLTGANLRHAWLAVDDLNLETLASWNETRLSAASLDVGSDVRQVSTLLTWRPEAPTWLHGAGAPLVAGSARWVQARSLGGTAGATVQAVNVTLGLSQELTPAWRVSASGNANQLDSSAVGGGRSWGLQLGATWSPSSTLLSGWRYAPNGSASLGLRDDGQAAQRTLLGLQLSHGVSRDLPLGEQSAMALSLTQSAAVLQESGTPDLSRAWAHGIGLSWQRLSAGGDQTFGGLSLSDSRSRTAFRGSFQIANLQLSQRLQMSRYSSWSANFTAQTTRNRQSELDVFSGQLRDRAQGWKTFYSGAISYEQQRVLGVPRLRGALLVAANSQPLERRALGDIDAPRERISESIEARLEYAIGRLDARLTARAARVEGRVVAAVQARAQRRF